MSKRPAKTRPAQVPSKKKEGSKDPLWTQYRKEGHTLGSGSDASVVRAVCLKGPRAGEWHALKFVNEETYKPEREVEALRSVQHHPNVIELLQTFKPFQPERPKTVHAFPECDACLRDYLRRSIGRERISETACGDIARQLIVGIASLHHQKVIHRDLKPQNILVTYRGMPTAAAWAGNPSGLLVQIADFGRACVLPPAGKRTAMAKKTTVDCDGAPVDREALLTTKVTTLAYLSPEVLVVDHEEERLYYSSALDIWAFGAIMFEVMTLESLVGTDPNYTRVLQWLIRRLGPAPAASRGEVLGSVRYERAAKQLAKRTTRASTSTTKALSEFQGSGWRWVREALRWVSKMRPTANMFASIPWQESGLDKAPASSRGEEPFYKDARSVLKRLCAAPAATEEGPPTKKGRKKTCRCAGHCYTPGHRYHGGCDATELVAGSDLCRHCNCIVPRCLSPKHHGHRCFKHKRLFESLSPELRACYAMRHDVVECIPMDAVDFVDLFPLCKGEFIWVVLVALVKEPSATHALRGSGVLDTPLSVASLKEGLEAMLAAVSGATNKTELQNLNRQGRCTLLCIALLTPWAFPEDDYPM